MENSKIDKKTIFLIVYLASKISNLYITKLLKLLYIIDEISVKESGVPVSNLDYKVWQHGPVNEDVYYGLIYNNDFGYYPEFQNYFDFKSAKFGKTIMNTVKFEDDEFSEYELELIDKIINQYGKYSSQKLVKILHQQDSLWYKIVKENDLESKFKSEEITTSPYKINFEDLLKEDPLKRDIYKTSLESINFQQTFEAFA